MKLEKENVVYSFSAGHKPVEELSPGEVLVVETADCFNGQIHESELNLAEVKWEEVFPATGPFYIVGAQPGDAMEIEILDIKTAQQGIGILAPETGVLPLSSPKVKILQLATSSLVIADGLSVPVQPMVGVIGVAPPEGEIGNGLAGIHGGRLFTKEIRPGAKVYLPVFHPGALLTLGDVQLLLGDGAVSGSGIGTSAEVKFRVEVIKGMDLEGPRVTAEAGTYFLAVDDNIAAAIESACSTAVDFISQATGLSPEESYMIAGAIGQLGFCQGAGAPYIVKFFVPRSLKVLLGEE
jgi:amidase